MATRIPRERIGKILKTVLLEIQNAGGEAHIRNIFPIAESNLDLTDDELSIDEITNQPNWKRKVYSHSNHCVRAEFITKSHGLWKLTAQGEEAVAKLDEEFTRELNQRFHTWMNANHTNTVENEQTSASELIDWYWNNPRFPYRSKEEFCQCGSEKVVEASSKPEQMRAFLMIGVLIDQMMFTHFHNLYSEFRSNFKFPKLDAHGVDSGRVSPSWFVYTGHDYDKKVDWGIVEKISEMLLGALYEWLKSNKRLNEMRVLQEKIREEISNKFEEVNKDKLLPIIERIEQI